MKKILLFLVVLGGILTSQSQTDKETVIATVDQNDIKGHIYFLADDLLKGRETGTPGNRIAASYLANTLRRYGVMPNPQTGTYFQEVPLEKSKPPKQLTLSINGTEMDNKVSLLSSNVQHTGDAIYMGFGLEDDYAGKDVTNKLVIVKAGGPDASGARAAFGLRRQKQSLAKSKGAMGLIELLDTDDRTWAFIDRNFSGERLQLPSGDSEDSESTFTHVWVYDKGGSIAGSSTVGGSMSAKYEMEKSDAETVITRNVVGVLEGSDPQLKNEYIIYSGHYDHVGVGTPDDTGDTIYNGARDNAVGVTTVLSMAENLAKYPTKRSALFILFTAEEKGLLGSKYYVENPVIPLKQMVYCFNSDNAGYNDTSLATIIGLPRTTAMENIKKAASEFGLTAVDDPAPEQGLFDRSDNVHFAAKGIPAPTFSLGFTAFNGTVTEYYHRPADEADNLDYDYLEKFFKAYVMAGRLIANDPVTPFWIAGDKYEEAGKELYDK